MSKLKKTFLGIFVGVVVILYVLIKFIPSPTDGFAISAAKEAPKEYSIEQARRDCKWAVKDSLHDPSSAEFDSTGSFPVEKKKSGIEVTVTGRAKNGFGALRKMIAECLVDNGKVISLKQIM